MKSIKACLVAALVVVGLNFVAQATVMRAELSLASLSEAARLKPIAVKLAPNSPAGFSYADCMPGHMAFIGANGAELPFEVATWNTSGESVIWVRPLTTDDTITLTYGAEVTPTKAATEVWAEYSGVWHLDQFDPDATTRSQASSPNSTAEAGIDAHIADKDGTLTNQEGRFGAGVQTADASGKGAGFWMKDPGANSPLDGGSQFTVSGWFKHRYVDYNWDHIFYKRSRANNKDTNFSEPYFNAFAIEVNNAAPTFPIAAYGSSASSAARTPSIDPKETWVQLTFVYNDSKCFIYENGKLVGEEVSITACTDNDAPLAVGNNSNYEIESSVDCPWRGLVDEVRFSKGAKDAAGVKAEYDAAVGKTQWGIVTAVEASSVIVDSSIGIRYGEDAVSPSYGIHAGLTGEVEFSCPAYLTLDEGNARAICSGWTLYDIDGEELQSGSLHHVKIDFTQYSHCRLVWNWQVFDSGKPTTDAYVKDHLIAMWDCSDTAHIDATGWTDTSGTYKFVFEGEKADTITFDETGVYFPGVKAAGYLSTEDALKTFSLNSNRTLEIVYQQTGKSASGTLLIQSNDTYPLGIILHNSNYIVQRPGSSRSGAKWAYSYAKDAVRTISADYSPTDDIKKSDSLCLDGAAGNKQADSCGAWTHNGFTGTCLANYRNSPSSSTFHDGWGFIGKIMSIRIYSTNLTPEQKAANHAIDMRRFFPGKLDVSGVENGSIAIDRVSQNGASRTAQIAAVPDEGYEFVEWTGSKTGAENPTSLTYPFDTETTVGATFERFVRPVTFTIPSDVSVSVQVGGQEIASGDEFEYGTEVVAQVTPTADYTFDPLPTGWTQVGDTTTIARSYTVGYDPVVIEVPTRHIFTLNVVGEGSVAGGATGAYDHNTQLVLTATPAEGYHFVGWTGAVERDDLTVEVTVDAAKTLTATFEQNAADQRVVTFAGGANAAFSVTVNGEPIISGSTVKVGETVLAIATPNVHYEYAAEYEGWSKDGTTGAILKEIEVGASDINIVIPDATAIMFTLTVNQPDFGSIVSSKSGALQEGTEVTLNVSASTGYEFLGWTDDASGTAPQLNFTVDRDMTIGANIVRIYRKVTFTAPEHTEVVATVDGVKVETETPVEYGKQVVVTITPVGEFEYLTVPKDWAAGSVKGTITRTFEFFDQAQTLDLPAVTAIPRFEVVIDDTCEHGSISGTAGSYLRDETVTLTVEPDEGYVFSHWTGVENKLQLVRPLELTGYSDWRTITVGAVFRKATSIDAAYEQDGLLAMWDCRDKDHIDATGWMDVSGRFKFAFEGENKGNITYDKKGVYFPDNAAAYLDQSGAAATFDAAENGTLEIVFVQTEENTSGNMILQNNNTKPLGMVLGSNGELQTRVGNVGTTPNKWSFGFNLNAVRMISIDYTGAVDQVANALMDGAAGGYLGRNNQNWTHNAFTGTVLGGYRNSSWAATYHGGWSFIGKILSVRLYSKKLTPEQKLRNYQSDVNRFVKQSGMLIMFF